MQTTISMLHQHYFATMGPLMIVTVTAFVVMILEFVFRKGSRRWLTILSLLGVLVALGDTVMHLHATVQLTLNMMVDDGLAEIFSLLLLITSLLVLLFTFDYQGKIAVAAEHTYLILFALAGALAMVSAVDLVTLYVGLELLSVASYVLVALRRKSLRSVEAGAKYLVMGAIGSAILLYGLSFLYGISGSTNLLTIGQNSTVMWQTYPAISTLAFLLILAGLGVKLSLVPFHMWTPDAYDGAPAPISSLVATLSKSATFVMLLRILLYAFNGQVDRVFYWTGILAVITMGVGNLLALPQRNMKRLLAFSSIAQAGYLMIPFALIGTSNSWDWSGLYDNLAFYLFGYTFMTIGAFAVVYVVSQKRQSLHSDALLGLWQDAPWLASAMTIFLLSLAGMPLTAGFIGKFYIFMNTIHFHQVWLGIVLFAASVVSFYYYFGWIRKMFQPKKETEVAVDTAVHASGMMHVLLTLCVFGTLILGIVPALLLHPLLGMNWL